MTSSSLSIAEVIRSLNRRAPLHTAEEWDNVGLLLGDPSKKTSGAVVSIDLTFETVELAIKKGVSLIVNHHPCIFPKNQGLSRVTAGSPVYEAIRNGIAVAAYHTNFDKSSLEVPRTISESLGLSLKGRLSEKRSRALTKLVTYVPREDTEKVRTALFEAGAGQVGNYDSCSFAVSGEGSFRGNEGSKPAIGTPGKLESVSEMRLETVFPKGLQEDVLEALFRAHPYEEVAYDLYSVEQAVSPRGMVKGLGYGFWGEFPVGKPFAEFVKDVNRIFNIHAFWITSPTPPLVTRVGFVAGKGASFVGAAASVNCDLFITGEAGYHTALEGSRRGMAVMEIGHRESEYFFIKTMKEWLSKLNLEVAEVQTPTQTLFFGGMN